MDLNLIWDVRRRKKLWGVPVDSDGESAHLLNFVDEVLRQCEICRELEMAPRILPAGEFAVSTFDGKSQAIPLRAMDD